MVILEKDGFYALDDDGEKHQITNLNAWMRNPIKIGEDGSGYVTVGDLMSLLMKHENDIDYLFESYTRGHKLKPFYDEMVKSDDNGDFDNIDFLELRWGTDYFEWEDDHCITEKDFSMHISASGVNDKVPENKHGFEESRYYSFSLSPVHHYKNIPLRINLTHKTYRRDEKENGESEYIVLFEAETDMTLRDFIGGLLEEMSFHGHPEHREEVVTGLNEVDRDDLDTDDMISTDEFQLEILESDLKRLEENEKYEKAAKVKIEIDQLRERLKKDGAANTGD